MCQCLLSAPIIFSQRRCLDTLAQENCSFQVVWISYPLSPIGYKKFQLIEFHLINFVVFIMSFPTGLNPVASHLIGQTIPWPVPPGQSTSGLPHVGRGTPVAPLGQMTTRPSDRRGGGSHTSSVPPRYGSGAGSHPPAFARERGRPRSRNRS